MFTDNPHVSDSTNPFGRPPEDETAPRNVVQQATERHVGQLIFAETRWLARVAVEPAG